LNNGDPVDADAGKLIEAYKEYLLALKKDNSSDTNSSEAEAKHRSRLKIFSTT